MTVRKIIIRGGLILLGLPVLLALAAVVTLYAVFYFPNRTTATTGTITVSGQSREYLLYVPKSYDRTKPSPLVISLHPAMSWPSSEMAISQWNRVADENGFIVVYPAGTGIGPKVWLMEGRREPTRMPDVLFLSALIDKLVASYNIDPARIYADGMSNGGGMAFVLASVLSDRIAAVGMVSAARSLDWNWYAAHRPVPMIAFHGAEDRIVLLNGGKTPVGPDIFPSVLAFTAGWAQVNGCTSDPNEDSVAQGVTRLRYTDGSGETRVVLYILKGGGHQWPGGKPLPELLVGPYSSQIDATGLMWAFFREHPLRTK